MKDIYPDLPTIPRDFLVPAERQPDYEEADGPTLGDDANVGVYLSDRQVALGRGDAPAAIDAESGSMLTFAALEECSTTLARGLLALGLRTGERVAYRSPNVSEAFVVMAGIWKAGGIVAPIPTQATGKDIRFYLEDTGARFFFAHARSGNMGEMAAAAREAAVEEVFVFGATIDRFRTIGDVAALGDGTRPLPATDANMPAIIWHTGGTTGQPKACYHTHRRFILAGFAAGRATGIQPGERWSAAAPIGHALGIIYHTIYTMMNGATVVMIERFGDAAAVLDAIGRWRVDTMTGLSASWGKMLDLVEKDPARDVSSIRRAYAMWQSASSSEVYDGWKRRGIELLNNFGSTAFATWVIVPEGDGETPRAALGRPTPGYSVEAIERAEGRVRSLPHGEIGQMAVRGPTGLTYWNRPELQERDVVDGWSLSDDLIRFDEAGIIHYLGRTDYMISTGGFKVAPVEVENVLSRHPAVLEIAVVPGPCQVHGQMVVAYIVLAPGHPRSDAMARDLRDFAKSELVSYKCPRRIEFIDTLPRDNVGKVQTKMVYDWANAP